MKIAWTCKARKDLDEIFDYILAENPQAAADVLERIRLSTAHLEDHPGMGRPGRVEHTRELIIPGLLYVLPYITEADTITIVRVIHAAMQLPVSFSDDDTG